MPNIKDNGCGQRPGDRLDDYISYVPKDRNCFECDYRPQKITYKG